MTPSHDSAAARPAARGSIVAWTVLGLAVVLYFFRFSANTDGLVAITMPVGECLMQGERLVTCVTGFPYPPLFALLMVPLTFLPMWARYLAWYAVMVGATYGCFRICEMLTVRAFRVAREDLVWLRLFAIALSLKFVMSVFENQAYDVLVFFFILVGVYGLSENKTFLGASGMAVAVALKATPVLMLLYALWLRKWKVFALGVGLCAVLSLLPDVFFTPKDPGSGFLRTWIADVAFGGVTGTSPEAYYPLVKEVNFFNHSLKSFLYGVLDGRLSADFAAHKRMVLYLVYLVYGLAALAVLLLSARVEGALLWGASVVVISMLMLSPMSSKSHFVVLLLPHMAIVAYLLKHREVWAAAVPLLIASFVLNSLTSRLFMGRELSIQMLKLGSITIATLLLLAVVAVIVFRGRKNPQPVPA